MTRWIMLALTLLGFVLMFTTKSPILLGLGLLFAVVGFVGFVLALAADRVSASARPETSMASRDDLVALRQPRRPTAPSAPPARPAAGQPPPN